MNKDFLHTIRENAVLISSLLIILALTKQMYYYNLFNIHIVDYLSFGELLPSILDELCIYFLYMFFLIIYVLFFNLPLAKYFNTHKYEERKLINIQKWIPIIVSSVLIITTLYFIYLKNFKFNSILMVFNLFTYQLLILLYSLIFIKQSDNNINESKLFITFFILTFLLFIFPSSKIESNKIINSKCIITTNDTTYECSKQNNIIYVGKTENFYFTYNYITKSSKATSISELKSIETIDD